MIIFCIIMKLYSSISVFLMIPSLRCNSFDLSYSIYSLLTRRHRNADFLKDHTILRAKSPKKPKPKATGFGFDKRKASPIDNLQSRSQEQRIQRIDDDAESSKLDKWGLPPPSIEDIFPLTPQGTELIAVDPFINYTTSYVEQYIQDYYPNQINWKYITISNDSVVNREEDKMKLQLMHVSPPVLVIDNFLTEKECYDVQRVVTKFDNDEANLVRVASKTISPFALSKRTSTSWFCSYKCVPTVLAKIQHILGIHDLSLCEEPQIVQYQVGQEFTWHYDAIPKEQCENGGQRIATILIYLNTIATENGGSTTFRDLVLLPSQSTGSNILDKQPEMLSVQPNQGSLLLFFPSTRDGNSDDRTLHRSRPILINDDCDKKDSKAKDISKWILQIWVHERPYKSCVPHNNRIEDAYADIEAAWRSLVY